MTKKLLCLLLVAAMLAALLAGCGAASKDAAADYVTNGMAPAEKAPESPAYGNLNHSESASSPAETEQKLIKKVYMTVETEDLPQLMGLLAERVSSLGGYIESQELYNGSAYSSYRSRSAHLTIRIPAQRLAEFESDVQGSSNVVRHTSSQEDVTLTYVATESRIKALEVEQDRLLELLAKADNMSDLLEIESRLTDVRYELENITSQLRVLENKVSYATVDLDIEQVQVYTPVEQATVWQRIARGFRENWKNLKENLKDLFVWIVTYSPQLVIYGGIGTGIYLLLRRRARKKKAARANKPISQAWAPVPPVKPEDTKADPETPKKEEN